MRIALVSGGDYGIGKGITLRLAEQGYQVITFSNNKDNAAALAREALEGNLTIQTMTGDTTCSKDVTMVVDQVLQSYGKIDVLCLAAGIKLPGDIVETGEDVWDRIFDVNVKGVYLFCHAVVPSMIDQQAGSIILFSSPSANGEKNHIAYASSKGALLSLTKSLAMDCREHHIRVNAIVPGFTRSGMTEKLPAEKFLQKSKQNVAGRVNEPEDIANIVSFLISDQAQTISGAVIDVGIIHGEMVIR